MTEPVDPQHTDSSFSLGSARMSNVGHLTTEAIAAFVDGELRMGPHLRASAHLGSCLACAAEVEAQRKIRADLQHCAKPVVPESLLGSLRSIPNCSTKSQDDTDRSDRVRPRWRWPF